MPLQSGAKAKIWQE